MTHEQLSKYLGAYLDGELSSSQEKAVRDHLKSWSACQDELEMLQSLSAELKFASPPPVSTPPANLIAVHNFSHGPQVSGATVKPLAWVWWLVPIGVIAVWIFMRSASIVLNATALLGFMDIGGDALGWLSTPVEPSGWLTTALSLFNQDVNLNPIWLHALGSGEMFGWSLILNYLIWLAMAGILGTWFVFLWIQRNRSGLLTA